MRSACDPYKNQEMQKIQRRRNQLRRQERHPVRSKVRMGENDRNRTIDLTAVTAAGQKAADPSEGLTQGYRGQHDIDILRKRYLIMPAVHPAGKKADYYPAVNDKTIGKIEQYAGIPDDLRYFKYIV